MPTCSDLKRRRQAHRRAGEGWLVKVQRQLRLGRLLWVAGAGIAAGLFVLAVTYLSDSADAGRIIEPARNERTQGLTAHASQGRLAPNFEAQDLDGNMVRLSDFQGRPVIVNFWATWCTACKAEIPALQSVFEEMQDEGLVVLGVGWGERRTGAARDYMDPLGANSRSSWTPRATSATPTASAACR